MKIEVIKAVVLLTNGADKVVLKTNMPCPFVPGYLPEQPPLDLLFDATYDTGVRYCRDHLRLEPEVINTRQSKGE